MELDAEHELDPLQPVAPGLEPSDGAPAEEVVVADETLVEEQRAVVDTQPETDELVIALDDDATEQTPAAGDDEPDENSPETKERRVRA